MLYCILDKSHGLKMFSNQITEKFVIMFNSVWVLGRYLPFFLFSVAGSVFVNGGLCCHVNSAHTQETWTATGSWNVDDDDDDDDCCDIQDSVSRLFFLFFISNDITTVICLIFDILFSPTVIWQVDMVMLSSEDSSAHYYLSISL